MPSSSCWCRLNAAASSPRADSSAAENGAAVAAPNLAVAKPSSCSLVWTASSVATRARDARAPRRSAIGPAGGRSSSRAPIPPPRRRPGETAAITAAVTLVRTIPPSFPGYLSYPAVGVAHLAEVASAKPDQRLARLGDVGNSGDAGDEQGVVTGRDSGDHLAFEGGQATLGDQRTGVLPAAVRHVRQ